jgi:hypothetical protein
MKADSQNEERALSKRHYEEGSSLYQVFIEIGSWNTGSKDGALSREKFMHGEDFNDIDRIHS